MLCRAGWLENDLFSHLVICNKHITVHHKAPKFDVTRGHNFAHIFGNSLLNDIRLTFCAWLCHSFCQDNNLLQLLEKSELVQQHNQW